MTSPQSLSAAAPAAPAVTAAAAKPQAPASPNWGRVLVLFFLMALFLPPLLFGENEYRLNQFTRYMALALFALSVDLIWGYTGLLSLGQGLYFGLGAYAVGYSLKLKAAALAAGKPLVPSATMALPDFMFFGGLEQVPVWVRP